jgi:hypothetical protein
MLLVGSSLRSVLASTLSGVTVEDSFNRFLLEETTWCPWFNWQRGLLPRGQYSKKVGDRPNSAAVLAGRAAGVVSELIPRSHNIQYLDQLAADVWNYVHSLRGHFAALFRRGARRMAQSGHYRLLPPDSPASISGRLRGVTERIFWFRYPNGSSRDRSRWLSFHA